MFDYAYVTLETAMKEAARIHAMHTHNIANIDTPDFVPLEFDKELQRAVKRHDRKKVSIEEEMAQLSQNSMRYSAYVKLLTQKINILKTIASQGRR